MFSRILVEERIFNLPRTQSLLKKFPNTDIKKIDQVDHFFNRVKKPYLQKREDLQLFLGANTKTIVKEAPDAYGLKGEKHFYFIHAYNCIYECTYCYLQGYFNSPDIVLFLNYEDIEKEIRRIHDEHLQSSSDQIWFHAGEFSDSLALSHLTGEIPFYSKLFSTLSHAKLELRTKSANIKPFLNLESQENIYVSFSLSPQERVKDTELKTAPLKARLKAIRSLIHNGHKIALHFDPIIYTESFEKDYQNFIEEVFKEIPKESIEYLSLGVVRFTKDVFHQFQKNYPESFIHTQNMVTSFDQKIRYPKPIRLWIESKVKQMCLSMGLEEEKIYLCME